MRNMLNRNLLHLFSILTGALIVFAEFVAEYGEGEKD